MSAVPALPDSSGHLSVDKARTTWSALLRTVESGHSARIVNEKTGQATLLHPVTQLLRRYPATAATAARPELMRLMEAALDRGPQVVTRKGKPIAVLEAERADTSSPDAGTPLPGRLVSLGETLAETPAPQLSFGLHRLDEVTAGLLHSRLTLIAAPPDTGGGLLAAALARHTALRAGQRVLYGISGLTRQDVATRMVAAEAGVTYSRLRSYSLSAQEQAQAEQARQRLAGSLLWFDDGDDAPLSIDMLEETARYADDLALMVVDRLQHRQRPGVPLSGDGLPEVCERLAAVARGRRVPVVAVVDTDEEQTLAGLHPHLTLTLSLTGPDAHVEVREAGVGALATVPLRADTSCVRFTEPPEDVQPASPPVHEGGQSSPAVSHAPRRHTSRTAATTTARPARPLTSPRPTVTGEEDEGQVQTLARRAGERIQDADHDVLDMLTDNLEDYLAQADGDVEKAAARMDRKAIEDVMALFERSRAGARREHSAAPPSYDFLKKNRKRGADQVWEGRHTWVNTALLDDITAGDPASVDVTVLDVPGAYLNAFNVWLPQGRLHHAHHDPDNLADGFPGPRQASGIFLTEPPAWEHSHLPNPLGGRREPGPLLLDTATVKLLVTCHEKLDLCGPPRVFESWTSSGSETFLLKLRRVLNAVRLTAIENELDYVQGYIKAMYSKFASTMGESNHNRQIKRPDWMHTVRSQAFANLWLRAQKLHAAGLTIAKALGTDELHIIGDTDWRTVFPEGQELSQMKTKTDDAYTLNSRNVKRHFPKD